MAELLTVESLIALVALTAMEIVLGIDNIIFISILTGRLPEQQRPRGRVIGLGLALVMRILLLLSLKWVLGLSDPVFSITDLGIPHDWIGEEINEVSVRDIILFAGGLFLIAKSVHEVHLKIEGGEEQHKVGAHVSFGSVLVQIAVLDIIFSLDSVITAVGMARQVPIMVAAVIIAVVVMMIFAGKVSSFVERHPTIKMLALSFLILIGVMLVAEGIGSPVNKGYIYFAMVFALGVEVLNLKTRPTIERAAPSGTSRASS